MSELKFTMEAEAGIHAMAGAVFAGVGEMLVREHLRRKPEAGLYDAAFTEYSLIVGAIKQRLRDEADRDPLPGG